MNPICRNLPPDWKALAEFLEMEQRLLDGQRPKELPNTRYALLVALTKKLRRTNELCVEWIWTGKWPLMLPHEAWILEFRLAHGSQLARRLSTPSTGKTQPVPEEPTALHLLIVDSWFPQGLEQVLDSLFPDRTAHN
jgi:hypothetical protein